jgi:NodT family efflux transporter outer membrane factor (OMF) lipoprotein
MSFTGTIKAYLYNRCIEKVLVMNQLLQLKTFGLGLLVSFALSACAVGPDYKRPAIESPAQFKENSGWIKAAPLAVPHQGEWWSIFGDVELNKLEPRVITANQSLQASFYTYQQALALTDSARAGEFPTLSASVSSTRSANSTSTTGGVTTTPISGQSVGLTASWVPDFWGKVRRQVESDEANAEYSRETLVNAQLSLQSTLAQDYFQIRQIDSQIGLAQSTVNADEKSLEMTQNRYHGGVSTQADVAQAQLQLANAKVQVLAFNLQRTQLEHAIAVLVGEPPSNFSLAPVSGMPVPQAVPVELPSQLLLQRPDLIAAERQVAAANAQIGVSQSAYFPSLTLSATGGYKNSVFPNIISASNLFWSAGPTLAMTLFDGGARSAVKAQAQSAYKQIVAQYRQLSLQAIQQVEDQLAALTALANEATMQQQAVAAAEESLRLVTNQYKAGIVSYLNVITAETASYSARNTALQIAGQQLVANVALIQALGGGTDTPHLKTEVPVVQ